MSVEENKNELLELETSIEPLKERKNRKKIKISYLFSDKSTRNSFAKTRIKTLVGAISRRLSLYQVFISGAGSSSAGLPQGSRPLFLQRKS